MRPSKSPPTGRHSSRPADAPEPPVAARGRVGRLLSAVPALAAALLCSTARIPEATADEMPAGPPLEWIGEVTWSSDFRFREVLVGGLSAIACADDGAVCYTISDDRAERGPVRVFRLEIDLAANRLAADGVRFTGVIDLLDSPGRDFAASGVDPEGLALGADGSLWAASEGITHQRIAPWIRQFSSAGEPLRGLEIPPDYLPDENGERGVRENLGFESLALSPDGRFLFTAAENALVQDGSTAGVGRGSPARILVFDVASGRKIGEHLYWVDSIPFSPKPADGLATIGVNELLALDAQTLVTLERCFVRGVGNRIRLYQVDLSAAADLAEHLVGGRLEDPTKVPPAAKRLLLDLDQLGIQLDNLEGMSFGPRLSDGRRTLLLIGDNNFSDRQVTQLLAFAVRPEALLPAAPLPGLAIPALQGAAHRSPFLGRRVSGVSGVVTAVLDRGPETGFWMQEAAGDANPSTSDGIFVAFGTEATAVAVGDRVSIDGRVAERSREGELSVTLLEAERIAVLESGLPLPPAVAIGRMGRAIPSRTTLDSAQFDPASSAIDLFESLEGMWVEIPGAVVIGPTSSYGEIVVAPDLGADIALRTAAGGGRQTSAEVESRRLLVAASLVAAPTLPVGARIAEPITGVLTYAFGTYRIEATSPVVAPAALLASESTALLGGPNRLTVATYNVENLSWSGGSGRFELLARQIVDRLGSPDILALQEIQDDSGGTDDGVVTAERTLTRLEEAITLAGGPLYDHRQIDPVDGADGGRPGGNIRVAWLFNPERVQFDPRGAAGPWDEASIDGVGPETRLALNPARVDPTHPAFNRSRQPHLSASRKPLAGEFRFAGRRLFLINSHFNSKSGDDRVYGVHQPPLPLTEAQRRDQAAAVHRFVEEILGADPAAAIVVLGDLNEGDWGRPLDLLKGDRLVNLVESLAPEDRYTYIYRGSALPIDHILVSRSLRVEARPEIDIVHLNVDLPAALRASDHDPVVMRLTFDEP